MSIRSILGALPRTATGSFDQAFLSQHKMVAQRGPLRSLSELRQHLMFPGFDFRTWKVREEGSPNCEPLCRSGSPWGLAPTLLGQRDSNFYPNIISVQVHFVRDCARRQQKEDNDFLGHISYPCRCGHPASSRRSPQVLIDPKIELSQA